MITKPEITVSVCMATYNRQDYVAGQIGSRRLNPQNTTPKKMRPLVTILRARIMLVRALSVAVLRKLGRR